MLTYNNNTGIILVKVEYITNKLCKLLNQFSLKLSDLFKKAKTKRELKVCIM